MALRIPKGYNFLYLAVALLALLFLVAIAEELGPAIGTFLVPAVFVLALTGAMWSVRSDEGVFKSGLVVVGIYVTTVVAGYWLESTQLRLLQLLVLFLFFGFMASLAVRQVLFTEGPVDANRILGAIAVYLLIGLIWAVVYSAVNELDPGAFNGTEPGEWRHNFAELVYFSFVSLTTLGYGDISPDTPFTRFLVYLEAIFGQLYLAIMIAGLVGIRIAHATSGATTKDDDHE